MTDLLPLVPALPFAGFLVLALAARRLSHAAVAWIGCSTVGLSAALALAVAGSFLASPPSGEAASVPLWTWFDVAGLSPSVGLYLDPLSLVMTLVVTGVGFLIHLYSAEHMAGEEGYSRFFAYMNLFVGAMLVLVLAEDLVLLYLGWEGVGLCSYLLIGFWYRDPANGRAARKAFVVTRVGDVAMALGLFLLFTELGTLEIQPLLERAATTWPAGEGAAVAAAALLLAGAVGKSAQLPLQTWLPDAMAGPTPVSALIHAATMVTAGVYLIARTHTLFEVAPAVLATVAVIGAVTLLVAAVSALAQRDVKRILAYSTISQIGYMVLALGVGAWSAAIFHLVTHAFFKALLFLGAGAVILALHHEHDVFRMGGLRRRMPVVFWTFLAGAGALAGLPLVTAGFYSKDLILWHAWSSPLGGPGLWAAGWLGALLTALYAFRLVFLVFFGEEGVQPRGRPGWKVVVPLVVLAMLSVVGGFVELPETLGGMHLFSGFVEPSFAGPGPSVTGLAEPHHEPHPDRATELVLQLLAAVASLGGIALAWAWFGRRRAPAGEVVPGLTSDRGPGRFWYEGWGFDRLYETVLVRPFVALVTLNRRDGLDGIYRSLAAVARLGHRGLARTQTGRVRWYAAALAAGAVVLLGVVLGLVLLRGVWP